MGLFTNNKKLCPICGNPTPRLLASAVEGQNLCKECAAKIDLPDANIPQADRWLRNAGCKKIFHVNSLDGTGVGEILEYLKEPGDE